MKLDANSILQHKNIQISVLKYIVTQIFKLYASTHFILDLFCLS